MGCSKINHLKHFRRPQWGGNGRGVSQLRSHVIENHLKAIGFHDLSDVNAKYKFHKGFWKTVTLMFNTEYDL